MEYQENALYTGNQPLQPKYSIQMNPHPKTLIHNVLVQVRSTVQLKDCNWRHVHRGIK